MNYPDYECKPPAGVRPPRATALSYLFEHAMCPYEGGATVIGGEDGPDTERIGPLRNIKGEYMHVKAQYSDTHATGFVCIVDGPRLVLGDFDRDSYVTVDIERADSVTVTYIDAAAMDGQS